MKAFKVFTAAFTAWAETPAGRHALIAVASAIGSAVALAAKALIG